MTPLSDPADPRSPERPEKGRLDSAPPFRDDGKPNRRHDYAEDPETGCCFICGWSAKVHRWQR